MKTMLRMTKRGSKIERGETDEMQMMTICTPRKELIMMIAIEETGAGLDHVQGKETEIVELRELNEIEVTVETEKGGDRDLDLEKETGRDVKEANDHKKTVKEIDDPILIEKIEIVDQVEEALVKMTFRWKKLTNCEHLLAWHH